MFFEFILFLHLVITHSIINIFNIEMSLNDILAKNLTIISGKKCLFNFYKL